jgi:hypothetical protein
MSKSCTDILLGNCFVSQDITAMGAALIEGQLEFRINFLTSSDLAKCPMSRSHFACDLVPQNRDVINRLSEMSRNWNQQILNVA